MYTSSILVKFFACTTIAYMLLLGGIAGAMPISVVFLGFAGIWLLGKR
jgi:hypothetical protein